MHYLIVRLSIYIYIYIYIYIVCGENEEWNNCGSGCPPKCSDSKPQICTAQCVTGCFCKKGYKLDDDGNCISEDECPKTFDPVCPLRCKSGSDGCNDCFCDGLGNIGGCTKRGCPDGTIAPPGCKICEVGYVLNTVTNECKSSMFLIQQFVCRQLYCYMIYIKNNHTKLIDLVIYIQKKKLVKELKIVVQDLNAKRIQNVVSTVISKVNEHEKFVLPPKGMVDVILTVIVMKGRDLDV